MPAGDNHLLHLWEARHSLVRRWRRQKHNRQLKIRIAALTQEADEYAAQLADSNWVERCNTAAKQMSNRNTWRLFRALIDPSQTRTETQKHLQRAFHAYAEIDISAANRTPLDWRTPMQARRTHTWIVVFNSTI
ncbi:hypothetical protein HPB49_003892 [Dermacentor silvarum]|uniref:Uncharacterized protein n=1 Tax=Dermacentor silvarum TaxID=543639 RepID=A0ACB8DMS5_DERSI|nr:hypothetical protein HPB49_003892 [Dermacentor silvarum]